MEMMIYLLITVLAYKLLMPFVAWLVPSDKMNDAAKYIERTERRFPTKEIIKWFVQWKSKNGKNKKP